MSSFGTSRIGGSAFANSGFGRGTLFEGNRFGNRGLSGYGGLGRGWRGGYGWGGCWGCGLGFGWDWGFGWGWPYWGFDFGWGSPYWELGWDYPWDYTYYWGDYGGPTDTGWVWDNNDAANYSDYTGYTGNDQSSLNPGDSTQSPDFNNYNFSEPSNAGASQQISAEPNPTTAIDPESTPTVLYLKDGTTYQVTSYWSSGNTLHYVNSQGAVSSIDVNQIDLQRTVDENAKHGVRFWVKPQQSPPKSSAPAASAPAGSRPTPAIQAAS